MSEQGPAGPPGAPLRGAVRLTFRYEGDQISLVASRRVDKLVPPTEDVVDEAAGGVRVWAEVRGAGNRTLHRRLLRDPVRRDVEVFSGEPGGSIVRVPVERPAGVFSILVPDLEDGQELVLVRPAPTGRDEPAPAAVFRTPLGPDPDPGPPP